jgi:hypothetical protein
VGTASSFPRVETLRGDLEVRPLYTAEDFAEMLTPELREATGQ